ncbi:N-acetyltransferase [Actinorhabdospora filicis]|uniref:N-acetyltransferase n=1 Tax=Actinorhabdospora filicis TaxID=1785913 RepID=A0A9W6SUQ7_9ACTN|nr:GNAT family N-acetyltransferase [Actinorhabdospora filicis]GLZ81101.1 N-acetyltransferase [Actinorhabdospora filicis]
MITRLTPSEVRLHAPALGEVLADAVGGGSSVGFVAPLSAEAATAFWAESEGLDVWAAWDGDRPVGTIALARATTANGAHRAEVRKLIVHRDARGRGLARSLLKAVEEHSRHTGVRLLVLDTETGSPAERLYASEGWTRVGEIPGFALSASGVPSATTVFFKELA